MPELIRSIASRLREIVGNRRAAPRYLTHLEAGLALSISLPHSKPDREKTAQPLKLAGYTRDISATGLALVVRQAGASRFRRVAGLGPPWTVLREDLLGTVFDHPVIVTRSPCGDSPLVVPAR